MLPSQTFRPATPCAFEPALLRARRLFESDDLEDTRERISRVMQPHGLQPIARAHGGRAHMDYLRVGGIGIGTIAFGEAMRVDVEHVEDYHLLMFCLRGQADTLVGGQALQTRGLQGLACAPGERFLAALSADAEQLVLRLDRRMLEAHAGRPIRFDTAFDLRRPALQAWLQQLHLLLNAEPMLAAVHAHPLVALEMERLLVQLLLAGQPWQEVPAAPVLRTGQGGRACVRRAEAYMREYADEPLRMADIAGAAGVPVRTLQEAFQQARDCSPMQYLRALRLDVAHRRLREPQAHATVATVALDCGFTHLGRFAQAYAQRFGEAPSATLRGRG
ncbi:AraC family transcriptional regulator [Pseudorhodoferax soli]|uniref:AraC family transcriptional regulator n=1 Tax=Pseudorhodoferax soli TaxID=545864 RepID=A0A368XLN6_9BURK|nr:AraC family transcriptional regulator [Pseudorhodoferax soli]